MLQGLQGLANPPYLKGVPFPALLHVAAYCVPGGVRVMSISLSYPRNTFVDPKSLWVHLGQAFPHAVDRRTSQCVVPIQTLTSLNGREPGQ
jgi:hypothetical protein